MAARASAVIGVAARLSAALESGLPFAADLALLAPLAQGDAKLAELSPPRCSPTPRPASPRARQPRRRFSRRSPRQPWPTISPTIPSASGFLGKLKGLVSLRRVGADVAGDSVEAKLARAEAALDAGDLAKAVELVKSLPPQTAKATAAWLARAEAHLAAKRAVDQLAAHAVTLLGRGALTMTILRTLIWFAIAAAAMLGAVWLAERPGTVTAEWHGWRLDTSVGVLLVGVVVLILVGVGLWLLYRWIVGAPGALLEGWGDSRRRRGYRALTQGLAAVAAGDAPKRRSTRARPRSFWPSRRSRCCCRRRPPSSPAIATAPSAPSTPCSTTSRWPSSACAA